MAEPSASPELATHMQRELLVYGVQRTIICPITQQILDWRRAVYATGNGTTLICDADAWDDFVDAGYAERVFKGEPAELIDGRLLT